MNFLLFLSNLVIPLLLFYIISSGFSAKVNIYEEFVDGAAEGLRTIVKIMPSLIGLMTGVGILRASGLLDALSAGLALLFPDSQMLFELIPLSVVKMFSSSASTGLLFDLFKKYGTDSTIGLIASLLLSSTETIFYTISIYFLAAKVSHSRYTLSGSLFATLAGTIASILLGLKIS